MFKKTLSLLLATLLMSSFAPVFAKTKAEKDVELAAKVKTSVLKFGTGGDARVKVELRDKRKLEGFISKADEESFVVTDAKTNTSTAVAYPQVTKIKKNGLSGGGKFAIKLGIGLAIAAIAAVIIKSKIEDKIAAAEDEDQ